MPFEIEIEGRKYNTDELSVTEAIELERTLGKTWRELNPLGSAEEFQAFAAICLRRDHPVELAAKIVAELPLSVALKAARWIEDDRPDAYEDGSPKAGADRSTITSSTSRARRTAGPRTSPAASQSET